MGGPRSGKHGMQTTVEDCKQIDIRWLKKEGYLDREHDGSIHWSSRGESDGWIQYRMRSYKMVLNYRVRAAGDIDWHEVDQTIFFDQTPCHFGGFRKWFICSNCLSRVGVLYGRHIYFLCRKCCALPYRSNLESQIQRYWTKKYRLGRRIFEHYEYGQGYGKKRGMHRKTFNKLVKQYRALDLKTNS